MLLFWLLVCILCTVYCHHCYNNYCSCYYIPPTNRRYKYLQRPLLLSTATQKVRPHQQQQQQWNDVVINPTTVPPTSPPPPSSSSSLSSNSLNKRTTTRRQALSHAIQQLVTVSTCCSLLLPALPQEALSIQNSCYDMNDKIDHCSATTVCRNTNFTFFTKLGIDRIGSKSFDELQRYNNNNNKYNNNIMTNVIRDKIKTSAEPLYYPTFMFGAWNTTVTINTVLCNCDTDTNLPIKEREKLKSFSGNASDTTPNRAVDSELILINDTQYQYFATLANTLQNQITMNLGTGMPQTKIIANRAYNLIHGELVLINSILSYIAISLNHNNGDIRPIISIPSDVSDIVWDYRSATNPTLVSWNDGKHHDFERQVVSHNVETYNDTIFSTIEYHRLTKVELKKSSIPNRNNDVVHKATIETETITEYHKLSDNVVHAKSRMIIRITTPPLKFTKATGATADGISKNSNSSNSNAISSSSSSSSMMTIVVADYDSQMQRIVQSFTTNVPSQTIDDDDDDIVDDTRSTAAAASMTSCRPCVETPRGIIQCY